MSIINGVGRVGWKNYVATSPSYILDTYTSATVGYSLRKLSSAYTGSAIRVRRSSDNTEQNIGFDASGNLDTTALLAFVGSGNGFVTTWYNQSGDTSVNNTLLPGMSTSKKMVQTIAANQPLIVESGVVVLKSGKPTIKFSSNKYLRLEPVSSVDVLMFDGADHSFFVVYEKDTTANVSNFIGYNVGYLWLDYGGTQYDGNNSVSGTIPANVTKLISLSNIWSTSQKFYMNNSLLGTRTGSGAPGCDMQYIGYSGGHSYTQYFSEIIMYRNAQTSNISNINNAINSYYSIYPTYPTSLKLFIDAGNPLSYSGTGATVTDLTGTQNGTLVNGTSYSSADGGSFVLDGVNDYIDFGINTHNYQSFTYNIWVKKNADSRVMILFQSFDYVQSVYCGYQLMIYNGVPEFITNIGPGGYGPGVSGNLLTNGVWTCITARKVQNGNISIFQNGILIRTTSTSTSINYSSGSVNNMNNVIGVQKFLGNNISYPTQANIGTVKIYNEARTDAQILADFNEIKSRYGL